MTQYQYVDDFIAENTSSIGDTFTVGEFRAWLVDNHPDEADMAGMMLTAHRRAPNRRTFTTECLTEREDADGKKYEAPGLGPNAFYRVVETGRGVSSKALLGMHYRECEEAVTRWENEMRFRGEQLARRNKRAKAAFDLCKAEMKQATLTLHQRLRYFDGSDSEEDE